jgi:hypothetical protein
MAALEVTWRVPDSWGRGPRPDLAALFPDGRPTVPGKAGGPLLLRWAPVRASAETTWLWLCQMRRAPYSYDLLDNLGRQSPRIPRRDMTDLALGQPIMTIFRVTGFEPGRSIDGQMDDPHTIKLFGPMAWRYAVLPSPVGSQIAVALWWTGPVTARAARWRCRVMAWGDLLMIRKQLLTLARLAEQWEGSGFAA